MSAYLISAKMLCISATLSLASVKLVDAMVGDSVGEGYGPVLACIMARNLLNRSERSFSKRRMTSLHCVCTIICSGESARKVSIISIKLLSTIAMYVAPEI